MKTPENWLAQFADEKLRSGLYLTALPIGNLGDITLRALNILLLADEIWAEDTRNIRKLMSLYGIGVNDRNILACHDHNEGHMAERLVEAVNTGKVIAYVSDAGMPMISDPGFRLVNAARLAGIYYTVLPGASAVISALVLAGAPSDRFGFFGFVPSKSEQRNRFLDELSSKNMTSIVFESANRLAKTIDAMLGIFADNTEISIVREISKTFEEVITASIKDMPEKLGEHIIKGEIVIVISPQEASKTTQEDLENTLTEMLKTHRLNDAVKQIAASSDWSRNDIYELALTIKDKAK